MQYKLITTWNNYKSIEPAIRSIRHHENKVLQQGKINKYMKPPPEII